MLVIFEQSKISTGNLLGMKISAAPPYGDTLTGEADEPFFQDLKRELLHGRRWSDNRRRRHSALDYLTPIESDFDAYSWPASGIPGGVVVPSVRTHDESPQKRGTPADARLGFLEATSIGQQVELPTP
ncbi:hypothetical protein Q2K21_19045 [Streptomyces sp. CGMCC 4.7035]|nr:hypothetical protein [Streptomyces sp. CGMCC 4.7035]WNB99999.1 hypothetical protein Q2K21_19045 [Streptomyces sp. CGMCC 4.7035]